jgi:hypothetical protein
VVEDPGWRQVVRVVPAGVEEANRHTGAILGDGAGAVAVDPHTLCASVDAELADELLHDITGPAVVVELLPHLHPERELGRNEVTIAREAQASRPRGTHGHIRECRQRCPDE